MAIAREPHARSARCRAARPSRCDRTSDCSAPRPPRSCARPSREKKRRPVSSSRQTRGPLGRGDAGEQGVAGIGRAAPGRAASRRRAPARSSRDRRARSAPRSAAAAPPPRRASSSASRPRRARARSRPRPAWRRRHRPAPRTSAIGPSAQPAVGVEDRIEAVLPALIGEPAARSSRAYSTKPSPSRSPVPSIQAERRLDVRPDRADRVEVAGALRDTGPRAGRTSGVASTDAIIAAERHLAEPRHLAAAHLVQDLARLRHPAASSTSRSPGSRRAWCSTPLAMSGAAHSISIAVMMPSRPKIVLYQGTPA